MAEKINQKKENKNCSSKKEIIILALIFIVFSSIIFGAGYFLWVKLKPPKKEKKVSIEKLPVEIPRQVGIENFETETNNIEIQKDKEKTTEEEKINPAELKIIILNGGTGAGNAGKIKEFLVAEGYLGAQADNAKSTNYKGVIIYYQTNFKDQMQEIKELLSSKYQVVETKEGMNEKEVNGDIVIILGK